MPASRTSGCVRTVRLSLAAASFLTVSLLSLAPAQIAEGTSLTVTKTADTADGTCDADCSLREAIIAANAAPGTDDIFIPAGGYTLTLVGQDEDAALTGDLDITDPVHIRGDGPDLSLVQGCEPLPWPGDCLGIDRVFHIDPAQTGLSATLTDLTISNGRTNDCVTCPLGDPGSGVYNQGELALTRVTITRNRGGGGVWNDGTASIVDSRLQGNSAYQGGAITNTGTLTINRSTIAGNAGGGFSGHGGAIHNNGPLEIYDSTVSRNHAGFTGGAINSSADVTILRSSLDENSSGTGGWGGAISGGQGAALLIDESTFTGNVGGGIQWDGELNISDTSFFHNGPDVWRGTVEPNVERAPGFITNVIAGGYFYNSAGGALTLTNVTTDGLSNASLIGYKRIAGTDSVPHEIRIQNTLLTPGGTAPNCLHPIVSLGHNIDSGDSCGLDQPTDLTNTDPMLGPWNKDGGAYWLRSLLPGSPAIDAADPAACPDTDHRGVSRPRDGDGDALETCDIGAFEFCPGPPGPGVARDACSPHFAQAPGTLTRVNLDPNGGEAECELLSDYYRNCGEGPKLSADGQFLAFNSTAGNLVPGDLLTCDENYDQDSSDNCQDVFVRNRLTGETELVSVDSGGNRGNGTSSVSSISADGRFVGFETNAGLDPDDTNGFRDVYLRDRDLGVTEWISVRESGQVEPYDSFGGSVTSDGRFVGFAYNGSMVRDRQLGITFEVSVDNSGVGDEAFSSAPSLTPDGRFATFFSDSPNLVPDDTNGRYDVFVHDIQNGVTERVSIATDGSEGKQDSYSSSISDDGRFVIIWSLSVHGFFIRDRQLGTTERLDIDQFGNGGTGPTIAGAYPNSSHISNDGRYVTFSSSAANLVDPDTNIAYDVFVRDRLHGKIVRVSHDAIGVEGNDLSQTPTMDSTGRFIAFQSVATNFVTGDANNAWDVFLFDSGDADGDGEWDTFDNCRSIPNAGGQGDDADGDGAGDACDAPGTANVDCDEQVSSTDTLKLLLYSADVPVQQSEPCLDIGLMLPSGFQMGDVNCSGSVDVLDVLHGLRTQGGLPAPLSSGCPGLGVFARTAISP